MINPRAGWLFVGISLLALLAGCHRSESEALPPDQPSARDANVVMVTAEPIQFQPVQQIVEAVGTLHGYEEVSISAKVDGHVKAIHHQVSQRVEPGNLLLEIDETQYHLAVNQAEKSLEVELAKLDLEKPPGKDFDITKVPSVVQAKAKFEFAQAAFRRAERLGRGVSAEDLENTVKEYRVAQASHDFEISKVRADLATVAVKQEMLAMARQQQEDTRVYVPSPKEKIPQVDKISYVITQRKVAVGTFVRTGTELFRLVIMHPLKLQALVPERHYPEINIGQKTKVYTAAFVEPFEGGTVTMKNPAADPINRTFEVEVLLPNPDNLLQPGGFAKVEILTKLNKGAATVPLEAPVTFAGITKIFVIENDKAKEVQVKLGVQSLDWVQVTHVRFAQQKDAAWVDVAKAGLKQGTLVITTGQASIADGTPVALRKTDEAAKAPTAGEDGKVTE